MCRNLIVILVDFSNKMKKQNISTFAASTAFFFFLSIVPMLIMICTIIPYTPLTEENLVEAVTDLTPDQVDGLAESLISDIYDKSAGVLSVALIATIWSASKGVMALMRGLNAINGVEEKIVAINQVLLEEKRNYFVVRVIASFYTVVMLIVVILSLFLMVFGDQLVTLTLHRFPQLQQLVSFIMNFRFIFVWAVLSVLFAAVYAYVPDKKLEFREQIPGAVFSAVVWSVFSWAFSYYVTYGNTYGIYGSLSIIIIVLLWMYFCMYIIMIGAYLNRYFQPVNRALLDTK
ncbi:YihY/virulence factor BrkB family protein [uncultured Acetatifactor sp.]|uniref:YihY/virulence factor BrkB family protein n=1 Tax=uncultured Acetatifactor sp. TaxID=1671927 RepID=UPI00272B78F4|nr:YihY/virulence factor BrkB family protein [uncultured Acetatifactor sp.]